MRIMKHWSASKIQESELIIKLLQEKLDKFDQNNVWGVEVQNCKDELEKCAERKFESLKQKARLNWTLKGYKNSKFFN